MEHVTGGWERSRSFRLVIMVLTSSFPLVSSFSDSRQLNHCLLTMSKRKWQVAWNSFLEDGHLSDRPRDDSEKEPLDLYSVVRGGKRYGRLTDSPPRALGSFMFAWWSLLLHPPCRFITSTGSASQLARTSCKSLEKLQIRGVSFYLSLLVSC